MAGTLKYSCPVSGEWYSCPDGTRFAGYCSVNPCVYDCPKESLHSFVYTPRESDKVPSTFTCSSYDGETVLWSIPSNTTNEQAVGCCAKQPSSYYCPAEDLSPAHLARQASPSLVQLFGNIQSQLPVQTASVARLSGVPTTYTHASSPEQVDRKEGLAFLSVTAPILFPTSLALVLWLCFRRFTLARRRKRRALEMRVLACFLTLDARLTIGTVSFCRPKPVR
jgi:hypothetical protein